MPIEKLKEEMAEMKEKLWEIRIKALKDCLKVQCADGTWKAFPYMHGMANGLILALALMTDKEPEYLEAPAQLKAGQDKSEPTAVPEEKSNEEQKPRIPYFGQCHECERIADEELQRQFYSRTGLCYECRGPKPSADHFKPKKVEPDGTL